MKINLARYTSPFSNPWVVIGETLMLPALAIGLGIWINPLDPLWTEASFPWIWLAPVLLSLRYGPFPGLAGAVILFLAWLAFNATGWIGDEFPKLFFLGGLLLVMISGEFSSLWVARARRAETTQAYLDQRLEYLTHQYYLLRLSHDRLEQDLISRPMSMREALTTLRQLSIESGGRLPGAEALLRLFAQYCQIEVGAVYAAAPASRTEPGRVFEAAPAAVLGQPAPLDCDDPLVRRALEGNSMWHVQSLQGNDDTPGAVAAESSPVSVAHVPAAGEVRAQAPERTDNNFQKNGGTAAQPSRYLIVAPLITFDGERAGLLTIERLPFFALHSETLQTLDLLLGYYTDGLAIRRLAEPVRVVWDDCPPEFASELTRLSRVARDSQVASLIVALEFVEPETPEGETATEGIGDMPVEIQRQRRMLDVSWLIRRDGDQQRTVLLTLMPLAGPAAAEGYIARVEKWVRQQRQLSLLDAGVFTHQWTVNGDAPAAQLTALLALCHVAPQARPADPPRADS